MKKSILTIALLCIFFACKREYDESKFGPEVIIVPSDFTVPGFSVSPSNTISLATEDVYFNCAMSQRAEFKIIIKGILSGAEKTISGVGAYIDAGNGTWTGDSDNLYIFRMGEDCSVELSFHGATKKYYDTISLTSENVYPKTTLINSFDGIAFDKTIATTTYGTYFDGSDLAQSDIKADNILKTCEGTQSANFDGVDVNNSYYIGGMYFQPVSLLSPYQFNGYESDSLYVNAYVYSYGDNSANFSFAFSEDDNGDGAIDKTNDDTWTYQIPVEGKGWSLVSIPIKSFTHDNAYIGNGTFNLDKIIAININLNAKSPGTRARANMDYLIISYGRPFEP